MTSRDFFFLYCLRDISSAATPYKLTPELFGQHFTDYLDTTKLSPDENLNPGHHPLLRSNFKCVQNLSVWPLIKFPWTRASKLMPIIYLWNKESHQRTVQGLFLDNVSGSVTLLDLCNLYDLYVTPISGSQFFLILFPQWYMYFWVQCINKPDYRWIFEYTVLYLL